ncbi:geranylgeranyl reductase family protein [Motilibacter peucedani]|uniref:Geranylgeranyl reductase family protein n=1 Tax=Motilibacter peucedani TaxID=598650 RepID=A0A420XV62_9ACTN|nr:NAD(P)/FAD-dependent oxidoreductase [Motilibacter peucedani]RKS80640.1 geranylgeranyl reductase family protein [Motilibacter peucedani]
MESWDVVVVGAGPAGSMAAIAALRVNPSARVLLLDREDFPRDKVCGDGVAAHVLPLLARYDVRHVVDGYQPVTRFSLGTAEIEASHPLREPLHIVPRAVLDARLVEAAQKAGAELRRHTVRTVVRQADGVVVDGDLLAGVVVAADGAESVVRRQLGLRHERDGHTAVAIRAYLPTAEANKARIIGRGRDWPAYAWDFPIGTGQSNVGYIDLLRAGRSVTRESLLEGVAALLPEYELEGGAWRAHRLPLSTARPALPDGRILLTGDAAALVNPMSGEGIFYAAVSGALAGESAHLGQAAGAAYRTTLLRRLRRHFRHTSAAVRFCRVGPAARGGFRAAAADARFFNQLVDVAMGDGVVNPLVAARACVRAALPSRG